MEKGKDVGFREGGLIRFVSRRVYEDRLVDGIDTGRDILNVFDVYDTLPANTEYNNTTDTDVCTFNNDTTIPAPIPISTGTPTYITFAYTPPPA